MLPPLISTCSPSFAAVATATSEPYSENIRFLISLTGAALKKHRNEHVRSLTKPLMQEILIQLAADTEGRTTAQKEH